MSDATAELRIAVVGYGFQGREHCAALRAGIPGARLAAVIDRHAIHGERREGVPAFASLEACIATADIDAVIIATPHASHCPLAAMALRGGCHVLVEKPVALACAEVDAVLAVHASCAPGLVLAAVQNQRTDSRYQQLKALLASGALGRIHRVVWTATDWYRTQAYYDSAAWRGTWAGEGGGVLVNQAVHQLDLWCWLFGLPTRLTAHCRFGAAHDITVEDEVDVLCTLPGGGSGVFITGTGTSPGVNRLEVDCDHGRVVVDRHGLTWQRTAPSVSTHRRISRTPWEHPATVEEFHPHPPPGLQLAAVITDFATACRTDRAPLAPVAEVRAQVAFANAILVAGCSGAGGEILSLPLAEGRFADLHAALVRDESRKERATPSAQAFSSAG